MKIHDVLVEFAPGGNSASSYYAVTANFVNDFVQQKQEELQDLIDAGWTKQDLAQSGQEQGGAADIAHFEQVRDGFLKGLKPGFDAYLQGDTQLKDQLGAYWIDNDLPLNQDWEKIYGEPWSDDGEFDEGINEFVTPQAVAQDPGLEREKDVDVIFFGRPGKDYNAEDAWAALEEVLPAEYPPGSEKAQYKVAEVAKSGGAVVTTKPLSVAKQLVATFTGYGIKSRINGNLNEFAPAGGGGSGNYFQALASAWYNGVFDTGSLQKGIKSQEDVERLLNRGIVCPDGKTRKLHIDYNSDFDGVEIYSDDYYEYGDHDDTIDSRTGQKWGPYDFMAFSDEDLSEGLNEFAPDDSGRWYTDDQMTDLVGDGWWQDMDISGANIGVLDAEVPKKYMIQQAQRWLKRQGHDVQVLNVRVNDDDCEWYIEGTFPKDLTEFAPDSNDGGGEDDALRNYAKMWWAGDEATQMQIERALAKMGWEIGEDEGGYDNGGVFVVRAGDENGNSYQSWAAEDLTEGVAEGSIGDKIKGAAKSIKRAVQWDSGPEMVTPAGTVKAFKNMDGQHLANFVASRKELSTPKKGSARAFADKVIDREMKQRGYGRVANKDEQGVAEGDQKPEPPEADYGADYQDMVSRVKKLAGLGPLKTVYDPQKRVYKNVPTAVQPKKEQR